MRKPVVLGLLGLATALAPAFAGTVYVPVAPPHKIGDVTYRTQIVVGNPDGAALQLTSSFIPSGQDGLRNGTAPAAAMVPAKGTLVLTNLAPGGRDGMLEISGAPQLAVSARLEAVSRTGKLLSSAPLPVVGSQDLVAAGAAAQLQGIGRLAAGVRHRFGLINLGSQPAACSATAYRSTGAQVGAPLGFAVPARSHNAVSTPLAAFGSARFSQARVEVSCDAPFYAYAVELSPEGAATVTVGPSATLESELQTAQELQEEELAVQALRGDGDGGDRGGLAGGGDDEGSVDEDGDLDTGADAVGEPVVTQDRLSFPGLFLNARKGNSFRQFDLPLRTGVRYKKITVEFDLYLNKWVTPLFHGITALRRNDRTLYYGLIVRGDRAKTVLDLGKDELERDTGPWKQRSNYHVRLVTDAQAQRVTFELMQGGRIVHRLSGPMTTRDLIVRAGTKMRVDFGGTKVADGAYFPPFGWKYSNLVVQAEPF